MSDGHGREKSQARSEEGEAEEITEWGLAVGYHGVGGVGGASQDCEGK